MIEYEEIFKNNPQQEFCTCIICRRKLVRSSDEHIIPKALGGYMHTWNVCKDCNSKMGTGVDNLLVNHTLMQWERYIHQLKGESGEFPPSPFLGVHTAKDGRKYRITNDDGVLTPHVIQHFKVDEENKEIHLTVDAEDRGKLDEILQKIGKRRKITLDPSRSSISEVISEPSPTFEIKTEVDISKFRIGILKIAYEFSVTLLPELLEDECARKIADILLSGNTDGLSELEMGQNALNDGFFENLLGLVVDFDYKKRHFIMLTNYKGGLYCIVRLFDVFCLPIKLSDKKYEQLREPIYAINDFGRACFDVLTIEQLVNKSFIGNTLVKY